MDRRTFICAAACGAVALPLIARAQQHTSTPVVGFLHGASPDSQTTHLAAFREGLAQIGYVEGRNVTIEYRWAEGRFDRFPELEEDLVRRQANVIAVPGPFPQATELKRQELFQFG